jgi:hypothetical protein
MTGINGVSALINGFLTDYFQKYTICDPFPDRRSRNVGCYVSSYSRIKMFVIDNRSKLRADDNGGPKMYYPYSNRIG